VCEDKNEAVSLTGARGILPGIPLHSLHHRSTKVFFVKSHARRNVVVPPVDHHIVQQLIFCPVLTKKTVATVSAREKVSERKIMQVVESILFLVKKNIYCSLE